MTPDQPHRLRRDAAATTDDDPALEALLRRTRPIDPPAPSACTTADPALETLLRRVHPLPPPPPPLPMPQRPWHVEALAAACIAAVIACALLLDSRPPRQAATADTRPTPTASPLAVAARPAAPVTHPQALWSHRHDLHPQP